MRPANDESSMLAVLDEHSQRIERMHALMSRARRLSEAYDEMLTHARDFTTDAYDRAHERFYQIEREISQ